MDLVITAWSIPLPAKVSFTPASTLLITSAFRKGYKLKQTTPPNSREKISVNRNRISKPSGKGADLLYNFRSIQ